MQALQKLLENPRTLSYEEIEKIAEQVVDEAVAAGHTFAQAKLALHCLNQVTDEGLKHLEHRALQAVMDQQIPPPL